MKPHFYNQRDDEYKEQMLKAYMRPAVFAGIPVATSNIRAIDVSYHNGSPDFEEVKNAGIQHLIIKAGGADIGFSYTDPKFLRNYEAAKGLYEKRLSAYWFASPSVDISTQSEYFRSLVQGKGLHLCIDVEWPVRDATPKDLETMMRMFLLVQKWNNGVMPYLYSAAWWWNRIFRSANTSFIDWSTMRPWGAAYVDNPIVFQPFDKLMMWQFTSTGRVPGVQGNVDINYVYDESIFAGRPPENAPAKVFPPVPFKAKTKGAAKGNANSKLNGRGLMQVDIPNVELTVHAVDTESNSILASTSMQSWYDADSVVFDAPIPTPLPPVTSRAPVKIGYNVLNAGLAMNLAQQGVRFFMLMDVGIARRIKKQYPDAICMVRWYQDPKKFTPDTLKPEHIINGLGLQPDDELVVTGLNECDIICYGSVEQIERRAKFDVELAQKVRAIAPKCVYAASTFSVGTPDITSPSIVDAIKRFYAPHYNSGLLSIDYHGYSTGKKTGFDVWFARRWEFYFTACGFDNKSSSRIYMGETGIDTGSGKGFAGTGSSQSDLETWVLDWKKLQNAPLPDGSPSPVVGGAMFQYGGNGDPRWMPFELSGYRTIL